MEEEIKKLLAEYDKGDMTAGDFVSRCKEICQSAGEDKESPKEDDEALSEEELKSVFGK